MSDSGSISAADANNPELVKKLRRAVHETYDMLERMGHADREGLDEFGAVSMMHRYLKSPIIAQSFTRLWEMGRLNLSLEAIALRPEFKGLFSDEERKVAQDRLDSKGYTDII
jgi:hypothetical protein